MFKVLTVGLILFSSLQVHAMDELNLALGVSMKTIVRSKLWYEGVDIKSHEILDSYNSNLDSSASEELVIAVEKYEQI